MSRARFSPGVFLAVFCCAYVAVFALNKPLFLYYPLHGELVWGFGSHAAAGPAMAWYGFMASAGAIALGASLCVPQGSGERALRGYLWVFPCLAMGVCVFLLRKFFT